MKPGIAFFDFDGTITTKDTLLEFIKFSKGTFPFYLGFLLNSPWLVAYKAKLISNQQAKEKVLAYFFRDTSVEDFDKQCRDFANQVIPGLIRPGALEEINNLKQKGTEVVIVSASPENWVKYWTDTIDAPCLATVLSVSNKTITGKIEGKNCYGTEKVRRIKEKFSLDTYQHISAYGDSSGDKPMLQLAHTPHYKPFR